MFHYDEILMIYLWGKDTKKSVTSTIQKTGVIIIEITDANNVQGNLSRLPAYLSGNSVSVFSMFLFIP
jgi:hypothetical protein